MVIGTLKLFDFMDLSYDKAKALKLWKARLKQVKEVGNFFTGHGQHSSPFFSSKYTQDEKIAYINRMINENS